MHVKKIAAAVLALLSTTGAQATNGYFSHGYGMKAKGMGGVGIAMPQDAMVGATNPAGMAVIGDRIDFGADLFMPDRAETHTAAFNGVAAGERRSGKRLFAIPEFAYNRAWGASSTLGVVVYGNGGMNTSYDRDVIGGATSNTYSNLEQLFIAPTWTYKLNESHSIGVTVNLVRQTFEARGLQAFDAAGQTLFRNEVTDRGQDVSTGVGLKLGWLGQVSPSTTLGLVYQPKTRMSKFSRYRGLLAGEGSFDVPESLGIGVAFKASKATTLAADVMQINYAGVPALGNQGAFFPAVSATPLGSANGSGFGWKNMTVLKLGVSHDYSPGLTLRAGINHGKMPLTATNTFFNILAPATIETHLTAGATWTLANKSELTVSYMHGFSKGINGTGGTGVAVAGFPVNLKMHQNALGVAYGWKM